MGYTKHIILIYKRTEEERAELISSFFRITGIYVQYVVMEDIDEDMDLNFKDPVIVLNKPIDAADKYISKAYRKESWIELKCSVFRVPPTPDKMGTKETYEQAEERLTTAYHKQFLTNMLNSLQNLGNGEDYEKLAYASLQELAGIYLDYKLLYQNYLLRLPAVKKDKAKKALLKAIELFESAIKAANDLEEKYGDIPYVFYFIHECKRKVNLGCRLARQVKRYDTEELLSEIKPFANAHEEFTAFWTLAAQIVDEDIDKMYLAVDYYETHLKNSSREGDDERFRSYAYYRLGKYYEKVERQYDTAFTYYEKACKLAPRNYRMIYKVAYLYERKGDDYRAVYYYDRLLKELTPFVEEKFLTPSKCEYVFKVANMLMDIYVRQKQFILAQEMGELALKARESIAESLFIKRFYSKKAAEDVIEGMQERLPEEYVKNSLFDIEKIMRQYI